MAKARPPAPPPPPPPPRPPGLATTDRRPAVPRKPRLWRTPLVVGICLALGYGITNRLLALQWAGFVQLRQTFDLRPFPGTSLQSLRQSSGGDIQLLRADLDLIELRAESRRAEERARRAAAEAQQRLQAPEPPLESGSVLGAPPPGPEDSRPAIPAAPQLPPPEPSP